MTEESRELLTVDEVAEQLRVNPQTVRNWIDAGKLPAVRLGERRVRIQRSVLDEFIGWQRADASEPFGASPIDHEAAAVALDQVAAGFSALAAAMRGDHPRRLPRR